MRRAVPPLLIATVIAAGLAGEARAQVQFQQIQMHVWISETTEQGLRDVGTNLTYKRFPTNTSDSVQQISTNVFNPLNPLFNVTLPPPDPSMFQPPLRPDLEGDLTDGVQTQAGAGVTFSLIQGDHGSIDGIFRGIEQNNDVDLISKPELIVIAGEEAEIHAGGKIPYQDIQYDNKGNPRLNVAFKDVGVSMKIVPNIGPDNLIQLDIKQLEVTDLARFDRIRGLDLPVFAKRSQTGVVLVPDGQVLVIGGLSSRITRRSERRVPILGRIPILGIAFRGRQSEVLNTQLMIFVSPTVVDLRDLSPAGTNALDFWRDGRWNNEEAIADEIRLMETER